MITHYIRDEAGQIISSYETVNGKKHGLEVEYFPNGQIRYM